MLCLFSIPLLVCLTLCNWSVFEALLIAVLKYICIQSSMSAFQLVLISNVQVTHTVIAHCKSIFYPSLILNINSEHENHFLLPNIFEYILYGCLYRALCYYVLMYFLLVAADCILCVEPVELITQESIHSNTLRSFFYKWSRPERPSCVVKWFW